MAKTVNVQLVRLDFTVLIPQPVQPQTKVFSGFCCINILLSCLLLCNCLLRSYMSHVMRKPVFLSYANNKGTNQPAHPHSLISTFVVRYLV